MLITVGDKEYTPEYIRERAFDIKRTMVMIGSNNDIYIDDIKIAIENGLRADIEEKGVSGDTEVAAFLSQYADVQLNENDNYEYNIIDEVMFCLEYQKFLGSFYTQIISYKTKINTFMTYRSMLLSSITKVNVSTCFMNCLYETYSNILAHTDNNENLIYVTWLCKTNFSKYKNVTADSIRVFMLIKGYILRFDKKLVIVDFEKDHIDIEITLATSYEESFENMLKALGYKKLSYTLLMRYLALRINSDKSMELMCNLKPLGKENISIVRVEHKILKKINK